MSTNPTLAGRRQWLGLVALALPSLVVVMDLTVLHLAVPKLSAALEPSPAELLWIVDIYGFLLAGSLVVMGTLSDRVGRRRLLLIGAAAFAVSSVVAAYSTSPEMLILARAAMGVAGATLAPSTLSLIRNMFLDDHQRAVAIGVWTGAFAAGAALGPVVGGVLLENFWWGSVLLAPVPVMAALLLLGPRLLPEFRDPSAGRLDLASAVLSIAAVLSTVYGLKQVAQAGFSVEALAFVAAGIAFGVAFVRRQETLMHPLIDLGLFRLPVFSGTVAVLAVNAFVMFASSFYTAQLFQVVLGLSPLQAGLWTLPLALATVASSQVAPRLLKWSSAPSLMIGGSVVCAVGFAVLSQAGAGGLAVVAIGGLICALGAGPIATLSAGTIVGAAPPERAGSAASISSLCADLGGSLGIAAIGSVGIVIYRSVITVSMPPEVPQDAAKVAIDTVGGAVALAREISGPTGVALMEAARTAFSEAYSAFAVISVGLSLAAAAVLAASVRRAQPYRRASTGQAPAAE